MKVLILFLISIVTCCAAGGPAIAEQKTADLYSQLVEIGNKAYLADKHKTAAQAYYTAVRLAPRNPRAHLLFAESLASQGQQRRAEAYLQGLLKRPDQFANTAILLAAIERFEKRKPFVFSGSFVIKPSSNINNVSSKRFFDTLLGRFDIANGGDEKFGIGVELGGNVLHRTPLGNGKRLELSSAVYRGLYENSALQYWRAKLTADLKYSGPKQDWRIGLFANRKAYFAVSNSSGELFSYGLHGNFTNRVRANRKLSFFATIEQRDYLNADTLSGPVFNFGTTVTSAHARGKTSFYGIDLERRRTKLSYHSYWGIGIRAGFETNVNENLRLGLNGGIKLRSYDANFASVDFAREDKIFKVGFSLTNKKINLLGATPKLNCSLEQQKSNISLYSKNTTECQIGWHYRF